ncbi:hypothetical protein CRV02_08630 [Arcobacter sp. CECT 8989]|uniref:PAS domain-containing protein n=1 Tax=Arcobacter sp. CECT 8989 TaxID=2044509 RepID=UPI00100AB669|nr:PAS domain S-box protein [Arcobacter sp. CECT 8989]RXK00723.1 hypothetical protein CRV02_08630 [Arcobacter sp. CECT 8989]
MKSNRLVFRYSLLFLFLSTVLILALLFNKNEEIEILKNEVKEKNSKVFSLYKKETLEISELFFFNYVLKNERLLSILQEQNKKEERFKEIEKIYEDKLSFFRKHNIKEINFYSIIGKPIYKSSFNSYDENLNKEHKTLITKVAKKFNPKVIFAINDTSASLNYLKPVFNKDLKAIAVFEIVMDLPRLSHNSFIEKGLNVEFMVDHSILKSNVNQSYFKNYLTHHINPNFMYVQSFYKNRFLINNLPLELLTEIKKKMKNKQNFVVDYRVKEKCFITSFYEINNSSYMMLTVECEEYNQIVNRYNIYIYASVLVSFIIVLLLFLINLYYYKYKIIKSKLNNISKSIDKYVIVAETNLKGRITYVSQAFCNVSGYKKDELIGKPINIVRHPDISKKFYENMWEKLSANEVWEGEIKNIDKNGNSYWVRGNILPIFDINNKKIGYRSIRVNISDEKQLLKVNSLLKRDLFLKLNEIKTRDKMKIDQSKIVLMGQILDAFSNEWKKPISNLSSKILAFENSVNKNTYDKNYLTNLSKELSIELKILSMHLNEFKTLFSQNSNEDKYSVFNAIKTAIASVPQKDIKIELSGDENLETFGVSYDLRKIILGIVYNSFEEFRKKRITSGKITISVNRTNENILIKCKDNAGGIPQEFISKIFETGFSTKENLSSRGLPLHIAKLIVKKLDGDIWAKNEDDGCCFYIKLITRDRRESKRVQ